MGIISESTICFHQKAETNELILTKIRMTIAQTGLICIHKATCKNNNKKKYKSSVFKC